MAGPIRISVLANNSQARRTFNDTSTAAQRMGARVANISKRAAIGLAGGLAVAGAAAVKFGHDSVKSASDAEQSLGATETVYGRFAQQVIKNSEAAATAVGLSANEYRELANVSGAMLAGAGIPLKQVTSLTKDLTARAADMAATFGGTTREAVEAVGSLMRGEADPIERYGISIKASDVSARLAAKGLDKLTGGAKKQAEMQERVSLLMEKSSKVAGAFSKESDTLAHKQQVLSAKFTDAKSKLGAVLLPVVAEAVDVLADRFVPAVEDAAEWLAKNQDQIKATGQEIGNTLLPPLKTLGETAVNVAQFLHQLPGPVKTLGAEAALAALVLPRLTSAAAAAGGSFTLASAKVKQFAAEMTYAETRGAAAAGAMSKIRGAAGAAAGVGGMVALTESAKTSNKALGILGSAGGGAMLGFSIGGPWGAAIGGGAGALLGLATQANKAKDSLVQAKPPAADYAATLDDMTGAAGRATRAEVQRQLVGSNAAKQAAALGVPLRTVVSATLGHRDAIARVNDAVAKSATYNVTYLSSLGKFQTQSFTSKQAADDFNATINSGGVITKSASLNAQALTAFMTKQTTAWREATAEKRRDILATQDLSGLVNKLPAKKLTKIEATGIVPTLRGVAQVANKYNLTPKQIKSVLSVTGVQGSVKQVATVQARLKAAAKEKNEAKLTASTAGLDKATKGAKDKLKDVGKTKIQSPDIKGPVQRAVGPAAAAASTGGHSIGANAAQGAASGVNNNAGAFSGAMRNMVAAGLAAGRAQAKIKSPSRVTMYHGAMIVQGLVQGITRNTGAAVTAARVAVRATLDPFAKAALGAAGDGQASIQDALGKQIDLKQDARLKKFKARQSKETAAFKASHKGKTKEIAAFARRQAAETKRFEKSQAKVRRAALASTRPVAGSLAAVAAQQAAVKAKLDAATDALKTAKETWSQYQQSVVDGVMSFGSIMNLGAGNGFGSLDQMLANGNARADQAEQFRQMIEQLTLAKLDTKALDELIKAGPEAAFGTAQTLLAGGQQAITSMNAIYARLSKTATTMGNATANTFHLAGIQAAQGLVNGLTAESAQIAKAGTKLAAALVKAVKKALKIKSPSRVFGAIAGNVTDGLVINLDEERVKRAGSNLAGALHQGFGTPGLTALAGAAGTGAGVVINVEVQVAPTADRAAIGKEIQGVLDAYLTTGGRVRAL